MTGFLSPVSANSVEKGLVLVFTCFRSFKYDHDAILQVLSVLLG